MYKSLTLSPHASFLLYTHSLGASQKKHGLTFMTTIPFFFSKTITGSIQTYSVYYPDQLTSALMESLNPDLSESKPCAICRRLLLAADFLYERFSDCSTREKTTNSLQQLYLDIFEDPCQEISLVITMKSLSWSDLIQKAARIEISWTALDVP